MLDLAFLTVGKNGQRVTFPMSSMSSLLTAFFLLPFPGVDSKMFPSDFDGVGRDAFGATTFFLRDERTFFQAWFKADPVYLSFTSS
jgi:hypothetical protein